ncbi:MAG TPA: ATP-binding cassette domain-containing protein [Burkholderiaceae bacterium]
MIRLEEVSKQFHGGRRALDRITLDVAAGEYVAVCGPAGAGKSSLLDVLALLQPPGQGRYLLGGADYAGARDSVQDAVRRKQIGYVFQELHVLNEQSVAVNVALGLGASRPNAEQSEAMATLLERFGLAERMDDPVAHLSRSEKYVVALARAVVGRPPLLLADEPVATFDARQTSQAMQLLRTLHEQGTTIVMATNDPACAAHAPRCIQLREGRITVDARVR